MDNDPSPFGVWQPWSVHEVALLFSSVTVPWWIAGGWALDLFLGIQTREHEDIDVQTEARQAPLQTKPWGFKEFTMRDPSGNLIIFAEHIPEADTSIGQGA